MVSFPLDIPPNSQFPLQNIPFGIFSTSDGRKRAGVAIGDYVVDLALLEKKGLFKSISDSFGDVFCQETLNKYASLSGDLRRKTRQTLISLLSTGDSELFQKSDLNKNAFIRAEDVKMHLPMFIPEFTDFSTAEEHVRNCFGMTNMNWNPDGNFYYSPMAYTGRCSSIIPSPTPITRPNGMFKTSPSSPPKYQPTRKLDYELELAFFISTPVPNGTIVAPDDAESHIFGFVLMNDWSARDMQMYESLPVGPLNGKAFGTTISPWIVMPEALEYTRTEPLGQRERHDRIPAHIKHKDVSKVTYDITCHASIVRKGSGQTKQISTSNTKDLFYSPAQLLAHRSSTGCGMPTGELIGLGTVSSPASESSDKSIERRGCLFEITNDGKAEIEVNGIGGTWLEDGDEVKLEAWAKGADGTMIGFGAVDGVVLPETSSKALKD